MLLVFVCSVQKSVVHPICLGPCIKLICIYNPQPSPQKFLLNITSTLQRLQMRQQKCDEILEAV